MEETKKIRSRSEIAVEDTWAIEDLYPSDEAWEQELATLSEDEKVLTSFAGKLGESAEMLYAYMEKTEAVNAKAAEVILRDEHDFILIYNGNYDAKMHKNGPESARSLAELRVNDHMFGIISNLIKTHWQHHDTLVGFAMDHGCHEIDGGCGSHGLDMPEDINIVHLYKGYPKKTENVNG